MGRFSESSEVGLTMMSPSRKPTQKAILEDDDGLNEDVSLKIVFKITFYGASYFSFVLLAPM